MFYFSTLPTRSSMQGIRGRQLFSQGIARFGNGRDALFFHYNYGTPEKRHRDYIMAFGSNDIKNTVNVNVMTPQIYKINSNNDITFYLIEDGYDLPEENCFTLIGRRKDGVWVKYFETVQVTEKYFGKPPKVWSANSIWCDNFKLAGDTMVIEYQRYNIAQKKYFKAGEFRFKWDDKAQWFGIEQVIY